MTREQAKKNLIALGIAEPTEDQVSNYLNQFHGDVEPPTPNQAPNPTPAPTTQPAPQPNPTPTPGNADLNEIEKLQKQIADLQKENVKKDIRAYSAEKGLTGEQTEKILGALQDDLEVAKTAIDSMSQIISDKETAAAQKKEQEIAKGSMNPGGGTGGTNKNDEKPEDVKNAESIYFGEKQGEQSMKDYYLMK